MKDCFQAAVSTIQNLYMKKDYLLMDNSTVDIGVSYDGSWHCRFQESFTKSGAVKDTKHKQM